MKTQKLPFSKVVYPKVMQEYEGFFIQKNPDLGETFMDHASKEMETLLVNSWSLDKEKKEVFLLIGKGNNGGDAFTMGSLLLQRGIKVKAYKLFAEVSPLSAKKESIFKKNGGEVAILKSANSLVISENSVVIDGILGTGFSSIVTGIIKEVIEKVNALDVDVFSIDIASGLDGKTGKASPISITADITCSLGEKKVGHFFHDGAVSTKNLVNKSFGLSMSCIHHDFYTITMDDLLATMKKDEPDSRSHKYEVGGVITVAGSKDMIGAANLSSIASLKSGCGLVKNFTVGDLEPCIYDEVMRSKADITKIKEELQRYRALLLGPGMGRSEEAKKIAEEVLSLDFTNMVIDGDGLFFAKHPPKGAVLTPHLGELSELLGQKVCVFEDRDQIQQYCNRKGVYIVVKGVPTVIFSPCRKKIVLQVGNLGMAKAGSGDVLSGLIASLLAQGYSKENAMVYGAIIHGKAGDFAEEELGRRSMVASDIIENFSSVFSLLQKGSL